MGRLSEEVLGVCERAGLCLRGVWHIGISQGVTLKIFQVYPEFIDKNYTPLTSFSAIRECVQPPLQQGFSYSKIKEETSSSYTHEVPVDLRSAWTHSPH